MNAHGSVSCRALGEAVGIAPRTANNVLNGMVGDGVLARDERLGYVLHGDVQ